ncbi:hypothetical protein GDO86_004797 [Hymenochirus boettgeri]|uniref:G-protein coupled receptors family 1 profile domain-containing protein n=1 Tax=Hymenochirus boettgeri TaxID=247094 RepID=A0A8T2KB28_9PIPI|nr:hypothetical protein GDO86_004797 [Hymenochirus boettgeri]
MNYTHPSGPIPSEFLLVGLSWIQNQRLVVSLVFLFMYMMVILGNGFMILLISTDRRLHKPMHVYIALLSQVDLSMCSTIIPNILVMLWFNSNTISSSACLTQMYVFDVMFSLESSLFVFMALDRYVAICHPLRHSAIMTISFISKTVVFSVIKSTILMLPLPIMTANLTFCKVNIVFQSYCEFSEVLKLICGDLTHFIVYMVLLVCFISGVDNTIVVFSYINIFRVVHMLKFPEARWKTLNTCSAHAILLSLFYISSVLPLFIFLYYPNPPLQLKILPVITSFILLPLINPIVYGLKTKDIWDGLKIFYWRF